jgi:UDP-N-acetylmuramyl pentapeptide phosphotransferase/UDP-N-acetylglucosamine-1-phosphate transferase
VMGTCHLVTYGRMSTRSWDVDFADVPSMGGVAIVPWFCCSAHFIPLCSRNGLWVEVGMRGRIGMID